MEKGDLIRAQDLPCNKKVIDKFSSDTKTTHFGSNSLTPRVDKSPITHLFFGIFAPFCVSRFVFFHGTDSNVKTIIRQLNQDFNFYFYI